MHTQRPCVQYSESAKERVHSSARVSLSILMNGLLLKCEGFRTREWLEPRLYTVHRTHIHFVYCQYIFHFVQTQWIDLIERVEVVCKDLEDSLVVHTFIHSVVNVHNCYLYHNPTKFHCSEIDFPVNWILGILTRTFLLVPSLELR